MPNANRWQSTYVRYKGQSEGQVCQDGWDKSTSLNFQEHVMTHSGTYPTRAHLRNGLTPTGVNMRIITAPAEFAVPVKQDRRLTPDFKVRVEVRYRGKVSFPLTVRARILSQQEKDNLPEWTPDGMEDPLHFVKPPCQLVGGGKGVMGDRKPPTELKGTTYITHHFEANMSGPLTTSIHPPITSGMQPQLVLQSNLVGHQRSNPFSPQIVPSTVIQTSQYGHQSQLPMHQEPTQTHRFIQHQSNAILSQAPIPGAPMPEDAMNLDSSNHFSLTTGTGNSQSTMSSSYPDYSDASNFAQMLQDILGDGEGDAAGLEFNGTGISVKPEHGIPGNQQVVHETIMEEDGVLCHDFEFLNLEFVKPTRMSKVYICFACTIADKDLLYCIYHIPTVGICRAEQRIKACEKLGIPKNFADNSGLEPSPGPGTSEVSDVSTPARHRKRDWEMDMGEIQPRRPFEAMAAMDESVIPDEIREPLPHSRQALREWIMEEYESTGLKRRLTQLDLETLESQAGFPAGGGDVDVAQEQWEEFTSQFRDVLKLLKRIAAVWDLEAPCVISGLNIDRRGTVQALAQEPPGTFICRLSWTVPGSLVLSCKVRPETPKADSDGLVHAIIKIDDLQERKVDTWIRDYPAATHVLDVYTCKRVDKRKVFVSNYMRIKFMEEIEGVK